MRIHARGQALFVARPVAIDHVPEIIPVDLAIVMRLPRFVPFQIRIRQADAQNLGLRHGGVDEFLAQLIVGDALDAPTHALGAVGRICVGRAKHRNGRPPPAVYRILHHLALRGRAFHQLHQRFITLALMKALFLADADHRARIRPIGAAANRHLVHDRRAIHQPADHAGVGPSERGVIEDRAVFGLAGVQRIEHLLAAGAQRLAR